MNEYAPSPPRAWALVQNALHLFLPDTAQIHPTLSTLLEFQLLFLSFLSRACHGPTQVGGPGVGLARAGPSIFQRMGRGPAQPITFSKNSGPAHHFFKTSRPGPARPITWQRGPCNTGSIWADPTITWAGSRGFDGPAHGPAHVLARTKRCMYTR